MSLLLQLQFSGITFLWLLGCLVLGSAYAFLLYKSPAELSKNLRNTLFIIRTLAVAAIAFFLFAPLVKTVNTSLQKPLIIIAQDNSASVSLSRDKSFDPNKYARDMKDLRNTLSRDYEVKDYNFATEIKNGLDFSYKGRLSDISSVFKMLSNRFSNRNVGALVLASDGIYNRGGNPLYESKNLKVPVYTIALGDTIPKDLLISNINYNKIAYLDNNFQLEVSVEAYQCRGSSSVLTVSDNSGTVFSKVISINSAEFRTTIPFTLLAKRKGIQRYTVKLSSVSGELSLQNNVQTIFIEVLDGRQNVLIIANSPHPDLAAIRQSLETNKNYQAKVVMASDVQPADIEKAGLVVLHQLPSVNNPAQNIFKMISAKPTWFILGAQSSISAFSASQNLVGITSSGSMQEAIARFQDDFYGFTLNENLRQKIQNFAPLLVPFGNFGLKGPASVAITQQIGKVSSSMPLLVFGNDGERKIGVLAGEGIWRWRLEEFEETENHEATDELLIKTVQYLSSRDDKRKFRVYSSKNNFDENEHVILNAELYNDAYELVNTPDVNIKLNNREGKSYSFLFSKSGNAYILDAGILPAGDYLFDASTQLGSKKYGANGQFVISKQQAEFTRTIANHQLLYSIARQNGGKMIFHNQVSELPGLIKANENVKTISYQDRKYKELINLKLIFFLILSLLTAEWFLRKRNGEI